MVGVRFRGVAAIVVGVVALAACSPDEAETPSTSGDIPAPASVAATTTTLTSTTSTTSSSTTVPPETTASPTTSTAPQTLGRELESTVLAMVDSFEAASADPANERLRESLADHATAGFLEALLFALDRNVEQGLIEIPGPDGFGRVQPYPTSAVRIDDTTALMDFCFVVLSEVYRIDGGQRTRVSSGPDADRGSYNFSLDAGTWKVSSVMSTERFEGQDSC